MSDIAGLNTDKAAAHSPPAALKVAARPEAAPPAISEKDLLRLLGLWQTSLEAEVLLPVFATELKQFVPYDSFCYRCCETQLQQELQYLAGEPASHRCSYALTLEGQALGQLELTRNRRFSEDELYSLERILATFIHSLRNVINYRLALQSAYTDSLTGVFNRNAFSPLLQKEVQRSLRADCPLSILLLDVDHFKTINDIHGHQAGDQVLSQLAKVLEGNTRSSDSVFRHGGEEFIVLLPNTNLDGARRVGNKICATIGNMGFMQNGEKLSITVSAGATALLSDDSPQSLVNRADMAMYRAKQQGRNRLCLND